MLVSHARYGSRGMVSPGGGVDLNELSQASVRKPAGGGGGGCLCQQHSIGGAAQCTPVQRLYAGLFCTGLQLLRNLWVACAIQVAFCTSAVRTAADGQAV